jgi:hypothetical protein
MDPYNKLHNLISNSTNTWTVSIKVKVMILLRVNILFFTMEKMYKGCILIQYTIHRILSILTYIIDIMIIKK